MEDHEKKTMAMSKDRKKNRYNNRENSQTKSTFKGKVIGLEDDIFDVGLSSDPAKFSKSLKAIETYIQKTYKMPDDIIKAIQIMKRPKLDFPPKPEKSTCTDINGKFDEDEYDLSKFTWKEEYKRISNRKEKYMENESNAWALIYDQCSPELKNKLEGTEGYMDSKGTNDIISLITMIKSYCCQFDTLNDEYISIVGAIKNLLYFFQKSNQSNADYYEDFMAMAEVIEEYGGMGCLTYFPNMIKKELGTKGTDMDKATIVDMKKAKKVVRDKFLAALMLSGANREKYGELKRNMAENYVTGTSEYPNSPEVVLRILNAYTPPSGWNRRQKQEAPIAGAMFVQSGNDEWKKNITCHKCGEKGHFARECSDKNELMHLNFKEPCEEENIFVQGIVGKNILLLDNQSTVNQISNPDLLTNIRKTNKPIIVHCNAGMMRTDLEGELGGMTVHHNPNSIANVLSLKSVAESHRITYDSWDNGGVFKVHTTKGVVEFKPSEKGLHYLDLSDNDTINYMLVNMTKADINTDGKVISTVRHNFEGYTRNEIKKAYEARRLQGMIGNPTEREFAGMVREKLIANSPVTVKDIHNANRIFGPDLANLRGKTTRTKPEHVRVEYINIPQDFVKTHKYVTLVADVMFVNGLPFLVTSSRGISLLTIEFLNSRTAINLAASLDRVIKVYARAGFVIQTAMMDMEFQKLQNIMPGIVINTTAAREHVGEIERKIRVIKERARGTMATLPYQSITKLMVIELMHFCVMWLNSFPVKSGVSERWSPREIVSRHKLDAKLHCKIPFGAYCEVHNDRDITNTMESRTEQAICLGPTGNLQGSYKFFSLTTGKKIIRRKFTEMPITGIVIAQIENWSKKEEAHMGLTFANKSGDIYVHGEEDEEDETNDTIALYPDIPDNTPGILYEDENGGPDNLIGENIYHESTDNHQLHDEERALLAAENSEMKVNMTNIPERREVIDLLSDEDQVNLNGSNLIDITIKEEDLDDGLIEMDEETNERFTSSKEEKDNQTNVRKSNRDRIPNRKFDGYELYTTVCNEDDGMTEPTNNYDFTEENSDAAVAHYIMVHYKEKEHIKKKKKYKPKEGQYGLDAGLTKFGDRGEVAVTNELNQFNTYQVFEPLDALNLSDEEKKGALSSLIFLKEKRNGEIKARSCANGSVQRTHVSKEEAASPTVSLDSVFVTAAIDAKEHRKVATIDIPGAFLHAKNEDYIIMKMNGTLAELMAKTEPKLYRKYLTDEKGKKVLYLRLQKALYGMMKSALLFYKKLLSDLKNMGFTMNPYDPCVVNKTVNGSQLTIRWHVDDLMISHKDQSVISDIMSKLKKIYGMNLSERMGPIHDYLGMTFDFSSNNTVRVDMTKYITKVISDFPEEISGVAATPAADHLFKVREDVMKLNEEQADAFHHTVYQLLFAASRARRDIQTAVSFLTTRVKDPDEDDWGKLKRILKYLNGTRNMKLTLEADQLKFKVHWYVDGSHQTHEDCRGQTGALMTLGKGAVMSSSTKMKCNTKSSTETELISLADKLPDILWMRYFIECQGYSIDECFVHQDNMSALSLEKNGRMSSSKRTKHIKAKYFLIKDYYDADEIDVKFCPTENMWADVLTKPLQGQKFRDMRAFLQNCDRNYDDQTEKDETMKIRKMFSSRECVDEHEHRQTACGKENITHTMELVTKKNTTIPEKQEPHKEIRKTRKSVRFRDQ